MSLDVLNVHTCSCKILSKNLAKVIHMLWLLGLHALKNTINLVTKINKGTNNAMESPHCVEFTVSSQLDCWKYFIVILFNEDQSALKHNLNLVGENRLLFIGCNNFHNKSMKQKFLGFHFNSSLIDTHYNFGHPKNWLHAQLNSIKSR